MITYNISEIFESINGEGRNAGQLAVFVRFAGCNLQCRYCDTAANKNEELTSAQIIEKIKKSGIKRVTVTGGEPLIQPNILDFLRDLSGFFEYSAEIETNGSVNISEIIKIGENRPALTMDYKLPSSGMEQYMRAENLDLLESRDAVKFVIGNKTDLSRAEEIIKENNLIKKCAVFFSPVFGQINPAEIADFMRCKKLNGVILQLQIHKYIGVK